MKIAPVIVLVAVVLSNTGMWWELNKPVNPSASTYPIQSLSLNPYQPGQDPFGQRFPTYADIAHDVAKLSGKTKTVRIYSAVDGLQFVPAIAKKHNINVVASAWIDGRHDNNQREIESLIHLVENNRNIQRVLVGNETQLHHLLPREELVRYINEVRARLRVPVSTAEPWDFWLNNPEFADQVDYIAIHALPYWNEIPIEQAVDYVFAKYNEVRTTFPNKAVIIAETGWPSDGPQRGAAEASLANQATFIREFVRRAEAMHIEYNIIEAFDQPWKSETEGRAGSHWGIMDASRNMKFPISGPVLEDPNWRYWAISSSTIGFFAIGLFFFRRKLRLQGQLFSAIIMQGIATAGTELAREASGQYFMPSDIAFWTVMVCAQALLAVIFVTDAVEIADVVGDKPLKRRFPPLGRRDGYRYPMVSIHVACCKEPPAMVIATVDSLSKLDYPNFEVIVIDNNTPDDNMWRPVEERCLELGERFRFYSLGNWPGYKAGALNFARKVTDPRAEIIGVVDADYVVEPNWLTATVPYFSEEDVVLVQAPQEHRSWESNLFQMMENDEYSGFFRIGMVQRNEDNAIIQHGTMTLVERRALDQVDGWAEWCICEDAELGLRLLNLKKKSVYIDHVFGRGLVPGTYEAYAKQRFRWAYGGMRILRRYWRELFGLRGNLSFAQRYQFVKGWLPWVGDALHMLFTGLALFWSAMIIIDPLRTEFPADVFVYPALALVLLRLVGTALTYAKRVRIGKDRTLLAMIAGGSLTHTIAKAVVQGLLTSSQPFYRTPKLEGKQGLARSLTSARQELVLALLLVSFAAVIIVIEGAVNKDALLWAVALVTQSFPYVAAVIASVVSSLAPEPRTPAAVITPAVEPAPV